MPVAAQAIGSRLADHYAPVDGEITADATVTQGVLPRDLCGTLYRNGPNPRFPHPDAHWFTGDGMIHAISLRDGRAHYRNRWVRTSRWQAEQRAGRSLFSGFGERRPDAPAWAGDDGGAANTNVIHHAGRLLALEEGHLPTALDPDSLATLGYADFGRLRGPFTAHPKLDPDSGELLFFGYNADGPFTPALSFGGIDRGGAVTRLDRIEAPYPSMVHDFMVTRRHVLFPVLPLAGDRERARAGGVPYAWQPGLGAFVGILPRGTGAGTHIDAGRASGAVRWFRGEACYVFHVMNAWDDGERILADVMTFEEPPLFPRADGRPGDPTRQRARLTRWTFDLAAGTDAFRQQPLDDLTGEFPRIDERRSGRPHAHGWFVAANPATPGAGLNGLVHIEQRTGRRQAWWSAPGDRLSEPVFMARGSDEADGWLATLAWRGAEARSELLLFEATAVSDGPVATVALPQRVPAGFHGNWVADSASHHPETGTPATRTAAAGQLNQGEPT